MKVRLIRCVQTEDMYPAISTAPTLGLSTMSADTSDTACFDSIARDLCRERNRTR